MNVETRQIRDDLPRYRQIAEAIRDRIAGGTYPVGTQLPTESELCAEFDISRHTAREALRQLAEAGLIQRRQGSGTVVIATGPRAGYVHSMRSLQELFQYAADTSLVLADSGLRVPGPEWAADLGEAAGTDWLIAEGLRRDAEGGPPISWSIVFINRDFAALAPDLPTLKGAVYAHVEARFGVEVAEVEQVIRVERLPAEAAAALRQRPKAQAVKVTRRYLDAAGRLLIASVNFHPAERFSYSMRLRREGGKGGWG